MDIADWKRFSEEQDPETKRRILGQIVQDNDKFIVAQVHRLMRRGLTSPLSSIAAVPIEDLIQAARIGYTTALERFNPTKGAFPTYAQHWIRHEVQQAALVETTIRKPKDSGIPYASLKKRDQIRTRYGREATADELGVTEAQLVKWRTAPFITGYEEHHNGASAPLASLTDGDEADGGAAATKHWLEDEEGSNPEEILGLKDLHGAVERLPDLEKRVIKAMYFGDKTITHILAELKIPCSTLYEVRDAALARLRGEV